MHRVVLTYGTFDLFHVGHLRLLERARALGDRLVVGVSTDDFNAQKGKRCVIPFEHRRDIVSSLRVVDLVIPEESWDQKVSDVQKHGVAVFVMGDDWAGRFDFLEKHCEVRYLSRTDGISSSLLRSSVDEDQQAHLEAVSSTYLRRPA